MNIKSDPDVVPIISLNNGEESSENDPCANIYIKAINQRTMNDVTCPGKNTCDDCRQWAKTAQQCNLMSEENTCSGDTTSLGNGNLFSYSGSYLYYFFKNNSCGSQPGSSTTKGGDSINIGAIVGAICGLLIATIIFGLTVHFIYRYRRNSATKNIPSNQENKYKLSASDSGHVSVATSVSSRYALQKSFFPAIQPNDEIAPPLYTAPSESVGSVSNYKVPPVPSAPRASVSTHATHVYETLDT